MIRRGIGLAALSGLSLVTGGCLERRIFITSDPPGALATVNGVEVGRTPLDFDFEWYGTYDVRLELEGHETLLTTGEAKTPVHELPVVDLVTTVAPVKFTNDVRWHYVLSPVKPDADGLVERGKSLRSRLERETGERAAETPGHPAGTTTPGG